MHGPQDLKEGEGEKVAWTDNTTFSGVLVSDGEGRPLISLYGRLGEGLDTARGQFLAETLGDLARHSGAGSQIDDEFLDALRDLR